MTTCMSRRRFMTGAAASAASFALPGCGSEQSGSAPQASGQASSDELGSGGEPTVPARLAELSVQHGRGVPICFIDLAALDNNIDLMVQQTQARGFALRPAMKLFRTPDLAAYVLSRLPEPLGLIFHLDDMYRQISPAIPMGTDLMTGYPPTVHELADFLRRPPTPVEQQRVSRLRINIDSVALLQHAADLAANANRPLPIDIALEFHSGSGRGGLRTPEEISQAIDILRANRDRLRLAGLICYDGHATFQSSPLFRQTIAQDTQRRYAEYIAQLRAEASDLADIDNIPHNGPGSSNFKNWDPSGPGNEASPGTAFLFHGYITNDDYDYPNYQPTVFEGAPVQRVTSGNPSVPLEETAPPNAPREEIIIKGGGWPDAGGDLPAYIFPEGLMDDDASGGRGGTNASALTAPAGVLKLGDYVVLRAADGAYDVDYFSTVHAVRDGVIRARWAVQGQWQATLPPV